MITKNPHVTKFKTMCLNGQTLEHKWIFNGLKNNKPIWTKTVTILENKKFENTNLIPRGLDATIFSIANKFTPLGVIIRMIGKEQPKRKTIIAHLKGWIKNSFRSSDDWCDDNYYDEGE